MNSHNDIRVSLREWVLMHSTNATNTPLTDSTPLIRQRWLNSLQVMDLLLFIETLREQPLDAGMLKRGSFDSIDAIVEHFFANKPGDNGYVL